MGNKDFLYKKTEKYKALAKEKGYSSRATFKFEEIDKKYKILKKNSTVLDLGYWPGGWIDYCIPKSKLCIGIDLKDTGKYKNKKNVKLIIKDVFDEDIIDYIDKELNTQEVDIVLSDMMSKTTGQKDIDNYNSFKLVNRALYIANKKLKDKGFFVAKIFESVYAQDLIKEIKEGFEVSVYKPKSSRQTSREFYIVCKKK